MDSGNALYRLRASHVPSVVGSIPTGPTSFFPGQAGDMRTPRADWTIGKMSPSMQSPKLLSLIVGITCEPLRQTVWVKA